jgi:rhodanese-related sulfurtransferase
MKKFTLALVAATALTGSFVHAADVTPAAPARGDRAPAKAHVLSRAELDALLADPSKVLVIDVRRPDEVSAIGGLPVYLSIQQKELANSLAWIPRDRTIVTLSNHAGRASKAAELLASNGFNVAGAAGAQTYEKDGGTIVHIAVPPARPDQPRAAQD